MKIKFNQFTQYFKIAKWYLLLQLILAILSGGACISLTVCINYAMKGIEEVNFQYVCLVCSLMTGAYLINSVMNYLQYMINTKMSQKIGAVMRRNLLIKINQFPMEFFDNNKSGDIISKFTIDLNNVTTFFSEFIADFIGIMVWIFGLSIAIILVSWKLALITFVIFSLFFLILLLILKKSNPYFQKTQKKLSDINSLLNQTFTNSDTINSLNLSNTFVNKFTKESIILKNTNTKSYFFGTLSFLYMEFVVNFLVVFVTFIGIIFINNNISLDSVKFIGVNSQNNEFNILTIFILLMRQFLSPFNLASSYLLFGMTTLVSVRRLLKLTNNKNENNKFLKFVIKYSKNISEVDHNNKTSQLLEFKNVNFSYCKNKKIINNLSFTIGEGEFVGIVGETGSGKSTIINLLTKLYLIRDGDILLNGKSIKNISDKDVRENIFVIPQETHIFKDTIYNNIRLMNKNVSNKQIDELIKKLEIEDIFNKFKNKLNTFINDNNCLSNGEKQLISICRALVSPAKIIVLDEINSSMDSRLEITLNKAIDYLKETKTLIFIAHKLSAIKNANKIIVLKNGELIEMGTHEQLLNNKNYYYELWTN